jgi:hypothetical protein
MRCKTFVSGLNALFWCTEVAEMVSHQIHPFYSIGRSLVVFWSFRKPLGSKKMQNFCFGNVCTILVYRSCGNSFELNAFILLLWTQMMFGCVLEHLENHRHVKRCKTCISSLNPLLWITKVAKMVSRQMHRFYSIWPKMMFGCVLEHLAILGHVKRCKTCVWCAEVAKWFRTKCLHCTPLDPKWCMVVFWSI